MELIVFKVKYPAKIFTIALVVWPVEWFITVIRVNRCAFWYGILCDDLNVPAEVYIIHTEIKVFCMTAGLYFGYDDTPMMILIPDHPCFTQCPIFVKAKHDETLHGNSHQRIRMI